MNKRRLLDLCCGEGIASWGYWASGMFSEIVGVDIEPNMSSCYSFDFINADMMTLDYDFLSQFDIIHASPPCQAYSYATPDRCKARHKKLIPGTKLMLHAANTSHVIENVPGAKLDLKPNVEMNGLYFGLSISRPRFFYVSSLAAAHALRLTKKGIGKAVHGGEYVSRADLIECFGLQNIISRHTLKKLSIDGIKQSIPPIFTKTLAEMIFTDKPRIG